MAAQLLVLCGKDENYEKAYTFAKKTLQNGEARKKMQEIISAQEGNPDVDSEGLVLGIQTFDIVSECDGKVEAIDMKYLNMLARTLGAPWDATAWIFLHKKLYDTVHRWEILFSFYASSENKLQICVYDNAKSLIFYEKMKFLKENFERFSLDFLLIFPIKERRKVFSFFVE